jgi:signal transduction histidine kinase
MTAPDAPPLGEYVLRITGGPAAGTEFPLDTDRVTLGRAATADIAVPDNVISRLHTTVYYEDGRWIVKDLESTNGTWVKGHRLRGPMPVTLRTPVRIGNTLFEIYCPEAVSETSLRLDESLIAARVAPVSANNLAGVAKARVEHEQRKLGAIYKLQSALSSVADDSELYNRILEVISEVIPSDSSFLMMYIRDHDELVPVAERSREGRIELVSDSNISKSIVGHVKETHEGILSSDAVNDERFHSDSLCGYNIRSVMCVPMQGAKGLCGVIYVSSMKSDEDYDEDDLQLLSAICHSAGLTLDNRRLITENLRSERMAAIGMTAAGLSHYVKNILGGLEGSISLMRMGIDGTDESVMNDAWEILSKNHRRLSSLMLDLLNLSREDPLEIDTYNIIAVLRETVELVANRARQDEIEVVFNAPDERLDAEFDNRGIHRVVLNLLNNAIDAVHEQHRGQDGGKVTVRCSRENRDQSVVIEVVDNGTGIPADRAPHVFDMFSSSKGDSGTGLGLAVSKRVVENHGGIIEVASDAGDGATFSVKLPIRQQTTNTGYIRNIRDTLS